MPGDLHTHSSCSDGSTPIEKLPWLAACGWIGLPSVTMIPTALCVMLTPTRSKTV